MGRKDNLFFLIRQGWESNKIAAIIDSKAYRTLGSYSIWGLSEKEEDAIVHIDSLARGLCLFDGPGKDLPTSVDEVEPTHLESLIKSGEAALVALVPEEEQMNDTITVFLHTVCQVSGCIKPLKEDKDMLFRKERESASSPEPMSEVEDANKDTTPYAPKQLVLKKRERESRTQEPYTHTPEHSAPKQEADPDLEVVIEHEPSTEDRILEIRYTVEDRF
ncbi:hypothetical protein L211DRAFT_849557 [Terfezia boudieri ATCC MYA-4762]|uniref:Uncharacterized protein n=1 Tax=Terfezia boudieri ATCC MYA-4762 TaxID=1051890 RepID=A0A3N4LSF6_9PEZI|nr:hypothetical protein L211DRAFT_849557 [Terfezia boudieri ATCC MYA-4762]